MKWKKRVYALLLPLAGFATANATVVVVLYTPHGAYIGVDSRINKTDGSDSRSGCKVYVTKDFVWASAGLLSETHGPFDIKSIAASALRDGVPFDRATEGLERSIRGAYPGVRDRSIARGAKPAQAIIQMVILSAKPPMRMTSIIATGDSVLSKSCPGTSCSEMGVVELGEYGKIDEILDSDHAIWKEGGIAETMQYLISEQEKATPKFVSGPIAIIAIDKKGTRWISKGACQ